MARKKGAKGKAMVKFSRIMLKQAMFYKNMSLRKMGDEPSIDRSDKSLRTYMKRGEMPIKTLNEICMFSDVDIDLVKGKYNKDFSKMSDDERYAFWATYNPRRFPYMKQKERENKNGAYLENVLTGHGIDMKQYDKLDEYKQVCLERDLENGITSVLEKYFDHLANGDDIIGVNAWWIEINNYIDENFDVDGNKLPPIDWDEVVDWGSLDKE